MFREFLDIAGHPIVLTAMILLGGYFFIFPEVREGRVTLDMDIAEVAYANSAAYVNRVPPTPYQQAGVQNIQYTENLPAAYPAAMPETPAVQDVMLQEGHWIGLEVIALTPELAAANKIRQNVEGVLVDEVTLLAAGSGILAGDVIVGIEGNRARDLTEFLTATKMVKDMRHITITLFRNGHYRDVAVEAPDAVGFAQMEAAPTILPGAVSPHNYYGQCNRCHVIAPKNSTVNTVELGKDVGDTLAQSPPPINVNSPLTHRYRGVCQNCHEIAVN